MKSPLLEIIIPTGSPALCLLPFYKGAVPAGFPSPAEDFLEGELDLNELMIQNKSATFFIRVVGDSMANVGIMPNDILVIDKSQKAKNGSIVLALLNMEFTVKRFNQSKGKIYLTPENPKYKRIEISEGMELEIWGVVVGVVRNY